MIRDHLVCGIANNKWQQHLLAEDDLSYDKATKLLLSFEAAEKEMKDLVGDKSEKPKVHQVCARQPPKKSSQGEPKERSCHRCGGTHDQAKCRFRQAECRYCHKRGHIAAVCHQKAKQFRSDSGACARGTRPTHIVAESQEIDPPEYPMYSFHSSESQPLAVELQIQNVPVRMEVDTGASLSIMSHQMYSSTWSKECLPPLKPTEAKLRTYTGERIDVLGAIKVDAQYENQKASLNLVIVQGDGPILIGRDWLRHF